MWMSMIADGHDICCSCKAPFSHLLDSIFPEGHTDRNKRICDIIARDYQECHSGGEEEKDTGIPMGGSAATQHMAEGENIKEEDEDLDALLVAAAATAEGAAR